MAEETKQAKKKVYVETTVVSDATALPSRDLAHKLVDGKAVPKEFPDDALHIAIAATHAMDYLVSWNFKHITNGHTIPLVERICRNEGYACPCICTPEMLQGGGRE